MYAGDEFYDDEVTSPDDDWAAPPTSPDGKLRIMAELCSTCIFRPGNKMDLDPGRVAAMLREVRREDSFVTCHKSLGTGRPGVVCRGSDEAHQGQLSRIAHRLGAVVEVTEADLLAEANA